MQFHCVRYPMTRGAAHGPAFFHLLYRIGTCDLASSNSYKKRFFKLVNFNKPKFIKLRFFR